MPLVSRPTNSITLDHSAYSYLLGMYLGDGCLSRSRLTYRLEISLHQRQTSAIERVARAITALRPGRPVGFRRRGAVTIVNAYSNAWPLLFPQHGRGHKHERAIVLEQWQQDIVERHPVEFLRGCIESDGCRHRRVVAGRNYPAYSFTNHSEDILQIFLWACGLIGLRPRRANRVTASIARRPDVATLDELFAYPRSSEPGVASESLLLSP
jgi:hypothetical protein